MREGAERDEAEVFDFVTRYGRDRAAGEAYPLEHYLRYFPGHEEAIAREYRALEAQREAREHEREERRVGPYRLIELLGRGGQGAVWLAEDVRIARRVALKVLPPSFAALSRDRRERLRREAEIVSRLAHPGICLVHEAEIEREPPYIAMRLVEGETLASAIARARTGERDPSAKLTPFPRRRLELVQLLRFFERAARALHAAHEAGVVHRDVKPGNLMVTREGEPVVLDFGQARDERADLEELTHSGELFGTPAYMSPEQVEGRPIDRRTDVWSLGASLYEALTLERPFEAGSVPAMLQAITLHRPARPSALDPSVPSELDAVLETALEKDPGRRYASAFELAEDLRRLCEHEPVRARPAGPILHLRRWVRRHPALAMANAAVVLSLALGLGYALHMLARERRALDFAVGRHLAERALDLVEEDPSAALALGIEAVELAPNYLTRKALYAALASCRLRAQLEATGAQRFIGLALDPAAPLVAGLLDEGSLCIYERESGRELSRVRAHTGSPGDLAMDPRGRFVATIGEEGALRVWSHPDLRLLAEHRPPGERALALDIDASGARIAVAMGDSWSWYGSEGGSRSGIGAPSASVKRVFLAPGGARALTQPEARAGAPAQWWSAEEGGALRSMLHPGGPIACADLDPAGERAATGCAQGLLALWSLATGELEREPLRFEAGLRSVAFSPAGERLALLLDEPRESVALLVEPGSGARIELNGHEGGPILDARFSPDGRWLATAGSDLSVRLWKVADGKERALLRGFIQPHEISWSADGKRLITRNVSSWADVWYASEPPDLYSLGPPGAPLVWAEFAPDGERAITAARDGVARLWSTPSAPGADGAGELVVALAGHAGPLTRAFFVSAGEQVVTLGEDGRALLWEAASGALLGALLEHAAPLLQGGCAPDGRSLVLLAADGKAFAIDLGADRAAQPALLPLASARCLAFDAHEGRIAIGGAAGELALLADATERGLADLRRLRLPASVELVDLDFDPRGAELAIACSDGRVRFVDLASGAPSRAELRVFPPRTLRWSPAGTRLLLTGERGRGAFRLHDLEAGKVLGMHVFHRDRLSGGCFSADGSLVLTSSLDGTAYVREALDGSPTAHLALHRGALVHACFAPAGSAARVLTAGADGSARVWPLDVLGAARARRPRALRSWEVDRERRLARPLSYR